MLPPSAVSQERFQSAPGARATLRPASPARGAPAPGQAHSLVQTHALSIIRPLRAAVAAARSAHPAAAARAVSGPDDKAVDRPKEFTPRSRGKLLRQAPVIPGGARDPLRSSDLSLSVERRGPKNPVARTSPAG